MAAPAKRVSPQNAARDTDAEGGVTVMSDLMGGQLPEVEVDAIAEAPKPSGGVPMVVVRLNDSIEDMSYVASGRKERYTFEAGNRYRVPVYIAQELEAMGKIWH